jgi:hypothetical protein
MISSPDEIYETVGSAESRLFGRPNGERKPLSWRLKVRELGRGGEFFSVTRNLSWGGVCTLLDRQLPVGEYVAVTLFYDVPDAEMSFAAIETDARVCYSTYSNDDGGYLTGLETLRYVEGGQHLLATYWD